MMQGNTRCQLAALLSATAQMAERSGRGRLSAFSFALLSGLAPPQATPKLQHSGLGGVCVEARGSNVPLELEWYEPIPRMTKMTTEVYNAPCECTGTMFPCAHRLLSPA